MPVRLTKLLKSNTFQYMCFSLLWIIGFLCVTIWSIHYRLQYAMYSFTDVHLAKLQTSLINGCSNLTDLPCSLQMQIDVYFFLMKFFILYFISIVVVVVYAWHRTVGLSHCVFAVSILADVIYRTTLVLYLENLVFVIFLISLQFFFIFSCVQCAMPNDSDDPLRTFCEEVVSPGMLEECFPNDHSTLARFYRWVKKIQQKWDIEEEKLIVTLIIGIVLIVPLTIFELTVVYLLE